MGLLTCFHAWVCMPMCVCVFVSAPALLFKIDTSTAESGTSGVLHGPSTLSFLFVQLRGKSTFLLACSWILRAAGHAQNRPPTQASQPWGMSMVHVVSCMIEGASGVLQD